MKRLLLPILLTAPLLAFAGSAVFHDNIKTLQAVVNDDWLSPPVMRLNGDVLNVGFDELSHDNHRYAYRIERCEADWSTSDGLFTSDWLEGFDENTIDDYDKSINTTVLYTHYRLQIPNERCRLKMSGNYRLHVYDEDQPDDDALCVEFRVVEQLVNVGLSATTNTDIDLNQSHQQVAMTVDYKSLTVTNPEEQLQTFVMQNGREDNMKSNVRPNYIQAGKLRWEHNRQLIFEAGNEYRKFEILALDHATLGIARVVWDEQNYHALPFVSEPRRHYQYDEDADGAFYIRNSDNTENDRTCDYAYVHYKLMPAGHYAPNELYVNGQWTTGDESLYRMNYDERDHSYNAVILQKQGYYSFQYVMRSPDGVSHVVPEEGSFFETENKYQAFVYYKGTGERTWRLVGYQQITLR